MTQEDRKEEIENIFEMRDYALQILESFHHRNSLDPTDLKDLSDVLIDQGLELVSLGRYLEEILWES